MSAEEEIGIPRGEQGTLLEMREVEIEGRSDDKWQPIIRGVDLTLRHGEVLGLIGESGAGKSTLGLAAMGFLRRSCRIKSGSILFDGTDLAKTGDVERRRIRRMRMGYVAQSAAASFNPAHNLMDQTIEAAVRQGLRTREEARREVEDLYLRLRLPNPRTIGRSYPHQVSGGQLQRAMVAMATICRPDLIVFDEPTTALDVTTQVEVLLAIRRIIDQFGTSALYITHDLAIVAQMADRIMVLRNGRMVETAATHKMLARPAEAYTRSLWKVQTAVKQEAPSDDIILKAEQIDAHYRKRGPKVLDDVTVRIPRARTVAIVGESGSGKSTLARVIAGLLPPARGEVVFDGRTLQATYKRRSREELKRIQLIYQHADTALNPYERVRDLIGRPLKFYLGLAGEARNRRITELLKMIDLPETLLDRFPGELSGGQKQRICIARALAAEPEVIICDEITSSLDRIVQEGILALLMRLQKELSIAYVFITHDIEVVRAIADEVVVMLNGRVVKQGLKSRVLNPPHPPYVDLLLSSVPKMDPDWLRGMMRG